MADMIKIWLETAYNPAFRCGGWAYVLAEGRALSGAAGGERTPSTERIALAALADAFKSLPPAGAVEVHCTSPQALAVPRRIAGGGDPPYEDLEYWAPITTVLKARTVRFVAASGGARTPTAFAAAWADLGRDKAKSGGNFRSAIPKTNLAKAGVPA